MESCLYAVLEDWSLCLEIDKLVYYLARKYSLDAVQDSPQLRLKHVCYKYLYWEHKISGYLDRSLRYL
jgi:hypothetical protein